jgi:hypothetical protein
MKTLYVSGASINEEHFKKAWARVRAGVKIELAAASVLPSTKRINSSSRAVYLNTLISVLILKRDLFTKALEESKRGGDWHKIFRGRRSIFWPDIDEKKELGLTDYTRHEIIVKEPYKGRPVKITMTIDHKSKSVREAVVAPLNGDAKYLNGDAKYLN